MVLKVTRALKVQRAIRVLKVKSVRKVIKALKVKMVQKATKVLRVKMGHKVIKVFGGRDAEMQRFLRHANWVRRYPLKDKDAHVAGNVNVVGLGGNDGVSLYDVTIDGSVTDSLGYGLDLLTTNTHDAAISYVGGNVTLRCKGFPWSQGRLSLYATVVGGSVRGRDIYGVYPVLEIGRAADVGGDPLGLRSVEIRDDHVTCASVVGGAGGEPCTSVGVVQGDVAVTELAVGAANGSDHRALSFTLR